MTTATMTISARDQKTLDMIEALRQAALQRTGIDVRTLSEADVDAMTGMAHDVRRAWNLEKGRRRAIEAGQLPADC